MRAFYSDAHLAHQPPEIISRGKAVPHWEVAARADSLLKALKAGGHKVEQPEPAGLGPVAAVHDPGYLNFLETAWRRWQELPDPPPSVQPNTSPGRHMTGLPTGVLGQAGYYIATNSAPIVEGTWSAALAAADAAVSAARAVLDGDDVAYACCRPPGHHAYSDTAGGFCYLNNVAIAATEMLQELPRVAILDVDVHHGNGTQGIFYRRKDVFFCSLHGNPAEYFPFYAGYAHERGEGEGLGYNLNLPQDKGQATRTTCRRWKPVWTLSASSRRTRCWCHWASTLMRPTLSATFRFLPRVLAVSVRLYPVSACRPCWCRKAGTMSPT